MATFSPDCMSLRCKRRTRPRPSRPSRPDVSRRRIERRLHKRAVIGLLSFDFLCPTSRTDACSRQTVAELIPERDRTIFEDLTNTRVSAALSLKIRELHIKFIMLFALFAEKGGPPARISERKVFLAHFARCLWWSCVDVSKEDVVVLHDDHPLSV